MSTVFWKKLWKFQNFYTLHKKNPKILKTFVQLCETLRKFSTFCIKKSCFFVYFYHWQIAHFFQHFSRFFVQVVAPKILHIAQKFSTFLESFQHFAQHKSCIVNLAQNKSDFFWKKCTSCTLSQSCTISDLLFYTLCTLSQSCTKILDKIVHIVHFRKVAQFQTFGVVHIVHFCAYCINKGGYITPFLCNM